MGIYGLVLISVMITLVGLLRPIPLTAHRPICNASAQMGIVIDDLGTSFHGPLQSQPVNDNNSTLPKSAFWSLPGKTTLVSTISSRPGREFLKEDEVATREFELGALPASSSNLHSPNVVFTSSSGPGIGEGSIQRVFQPTIGSGSVIMGVLDFYHETCTYNSLILGALLFFGWILSIFGWINIRNKQQRSLQLVNHEILEFLRDIQGKKADLMAKMDIVASAIECQIEDLLERVMMEENKACNEFADFLDQEISQLRETLQLEVEVEFERQASKAKRFIAGLESVRKRLPGPEQLEAACQTSLEEFQRLTDLVDKLRRRIHNEAESYVTTAALIRNPDHVICTPNTESNYVPEGEHLSNQKIQGAETMAEISEARSSHLAQWRMVMGNPNLSPEEIEHGRRIRRERVEKRNAEYTSLQPSAWAGRRRRRQRRSLRNQHQQVCA